MEVLDVDCGQNPKGIVNVDLYPKTNVYRPAKTDNLTLLTTPNFVIADGRCLPFRDNSFGVVLCRRVIPQIARTELVIKKELKP